MKSYVDFDYYSKEYNGTLIPEKSFPKISVEASQKINYFTQNRIVEETKVIKYTTCLIADEIMKNENLKNTISNDKEVASESVGPHSVSYVNKATIQKEQIKDNIALNRCLYNICLENLPNELMYRGINVSKRNNYF